MKLSRPESMNVFLFIVLLLTPSLLMTGCGSKNAAYYSEPERRAAQLDELVEMMTGEFSSRGFGEASLKLRTARIDDFKRALYVEVTDDTNNEVLYSGVWKFFDIEGRLEMQFWRLTEPQTFYGAVDDAELRGGIWMYHLRELDGCRMEINHYESMGRATGVVLPDEVSGFEMNLVDNGCITGLSDASPGFFGIQAWSWDEAVDGNLATIKFFSKSESCCPTSTIFISDPTNNGT